MSGGPVIRDKMPSILGIMVEYVRCPRPERIILRNERIIVRNALRFFRS